MLKLVVHKVSLRLLNVRLKDHKIPWYPLEIASCIEQCFLTFYVCLATCRFIKNGDRPVLTTVRINRKLTQDQCFYSHTYFSVTIIIDFFQEF